MKTFYNHLTVRSFEVNLFARYYVKHLLIVSNALKAFHMHIVDLNLTAKTVLALYRCSVYTIRCNNKKEEPQKPVHFTDVKSDYTISAKPDISSSAISL